MPDKAGTLVASVDALVIHPTNQPTHDYVGKVRCFHPTYPRLCGQKEERCECPCHPSNSPPMKSCVLPTYRAVVVCLPAYLPTYHRTYALYIHTYTYILHPIVKWGEGLARNRSKKPVKRLNLMD